MREDIRGRLIEVARHRGLIAYGELMRDFGIARGRQIGEILGEISEYEHDHSRPFLSAIVVNKGTLRPSGGFWGVRGVSRDIPWERYRDEVHEYWWNA
jgi:hypothetical protein